MHTIVYDEASGGRSMQSILLMCAYRSITCKSAARFLHRPGGLNLELSLLHEHLRLPFVFEHVRANQVVLVRLARITNLTRLEHNLEIMISYIVAVPTEIQRAYE
jgi:hypothetical protein